MIRHFELKLDNINYMQFIIILLCRNRVQNNIEITMAQLVQSTNKKKKFISQINHLYFSTFFGYKTDNGL